MKRAFTLVELLVVMAILAILFAIAAPGLRAAQGAVVQYQAMASLKQVGSATASYLVDHDDAYPLAIYQVSDGYQGWYGLQGFDGKVDSKRSLLVSYIGPQRLKDPTHKALDYLGDQSGFGYNWGYLGSDFNHIANHWGFPNCTNPARGSELADPSNTIVFSTSAYYHATWVQNGDGQMYDFGFIDPPKYWGGNPNMSFRHHGSRVVDEKTKQVTVKGAALVTYADSRANSREPGQILDRMFERIPTSPQ